MISPCRARPAVADASSLRGIRCSGVLVDSGQERLAACERHEEQACGTRTAMRICGRLLRERFGGPTQNNTCVSCLQHLCPQVGSLISGRCSGCGVAWGRLTEEVPPWAAGQVRPTVFSPEHDRARASNVASLSSAILSRSSPRGRLGAAPARRGYGAVVHLAMHTRRCPQLALSLLVPPPSCRLAGAWVAARIGAMGALLAGPRLLEVPSPPLYSESAAGLSKVPTHQVKAGRAQC